MNIVYSLVMLSCALLEIKGNPTYYPYYGANMDSLTYGAGDSSRGGMVLSRYYNPYYARTMGGGMAAFMVREPELQQQGHRPIQYYQPDRRRQAPDTSYLPPQQNEVYTPLQNEFPQIPERASTDGTDIAEPTEKSEGFSTTLRTVIPELTEPEVEEVEEPVQEPVQKTKKRISKKKQVKKPVDDEDEEEYPERSKMPAGAFFPMFFGWGGRSSGGAPGGATAIANAYSTGRGGVASSHATAYGEPRPEFTKSA